MNIFNMLFKKPLQSGGLKVVAYASILQNLQVFEDEESLEDAVGELQLSREGADEGYSIYSMYIKYRSNMVGPNLASQYTDNLPLFLYFNDPTDPQSIYAKLEDEEGLTCSYVSIPDQIAGERVIDFSQSTGLHIIIPTAGDITLSDTTTTLLVHTGEAAVINATTTQVTIQAEKAEVRMVTVY